MIAQRFFDSLTQARERSRDRALLKSLLHAQTEAKRCAAALTGRKDPLTIGVAASYAGKHASAMRLLAIDLAQRAARLSAAALPGLNGKDQP